jgi:urease accessory protein
VSSSPEQALRLLQLMQLADSALPIGGLAHSFGLETMIEEGDLTVGNLFPLLKDFLSEGLLLDAAFCRTAHQRGQMGGAIEDLNLRLSALRLARESREASLALGKRLLALANSLEGDLAANRETAHFAVAFGYVCGRLGFDAEESVAAFLQLSVAAFLSVGQRLLRLGQVEAAQMNWDLKPHILEATVLSASASWEKLWTFAHLPEMASMRHPLLPTRLFVS